MRRLVLLSLFFIPLALLSNGQQFKNYTSLDGLSTLKTSKVIKDSEGFIWIASENGLNRFDGINFKVYSHNKDDSTSLVGNVVMDLLIDRNDNLIVATNGGLCIYNKDLDNFYPVPVVDIKQAYCKAIIQDQENNYWLITGNIITTYDQNWKKLQVLNNDKQAADYMPNVSFFCIAEDKDGIIWIGTQNRGFLSFNNNTKQFTDYGSLISVKEIFNIFPDSYGNIWIGTHERPYVYKKEDKALIDLNSPESEISLPKVSMSHMFEDNEGYIWICNWSDGLTKYDVNNNTYEWFVHSDNNPFSFSQGSAEFGYQDDNGNVWVVGATLGLTVSYKNTRQIFTINDPKNPSAGIFTTPVTAITQSENGELWFGTDGSGFTVWSPERNVIKEFKNNTDDLSTYGGTSVLAAYTTKSGNIWSGGYNSGLNLFNPEMKNFLVFIPDNPVPYTISNNDIRAISEDVDGNIWVVTNGGGVNIYNPYTFESKVLTVEDGLVHNHGISIFCNGDGKNLIGTYGGLSVYDVNTKKIKNFVQNEEDPESLQSNWINCIYKDSTDVYWLGTQFGLSHFNINTGKSKNYFDSDGLINHSIMSIEKDSEGNLWIGTLGGLSKFNPENETFSNYDISDGLPDNQFRGGAVCKSIDNVLYFGTNKGVVYFNPLDIKQNIVTPKIRFTDILVNNEVVKVGESKILEKHINFTDKIILNHKENFVRFNFIAISFYQAEKNTFKYILEGLNNKWVDAGNATYASYTNLKHGKYIFKVQAFNNDGVPSEIKEIKVKIRPAWYNTIFFWLILISGFIYLIYYLYKLKGDQTKKDKAELEAKIKANEKILFEKIAELELKEKEIEERNKSEYELKYHHEGISYFSGIISKKRENIESLTSMLVSELVEYTHSNAGIIFIADDSDSENVVLRVAGKHCFDTDFENRFEFHAGEGYIGTCFLEKKPIVLNDLPDDYNILRSGLGGVSLKNSLLIPVIHEKNCLGVIELASILPLEQYKIDFVTKLSESFASVLAITKANEITTAMLEQNEVQSQELMAQEEEMRQNLEEMQATQEELKRQIDASSKIQTDLENEKMLIDSLLNNINENIYFKDKESRIIKASASMAKNFGAKKIEDIYGKSDFDFFTEEHAQPAFDDEMQIMKTGKPILDKIEKETHGDGRVKFVSTSKMPLYDVKGEIVGTFGISKDVTDSINSQMETKEQNEELQAQEEELRQNLEEMQTVQENLEEQIKQNRQMQEELLRDNALLDALMNNLPDFLYFKDEESRFIRISKSMLPLFPVDTINEMKGKSDFDFQDKESAQKYFDDEMNIIKTREPIIDEIAHEHMENGVDQWVSTSKFPLTDINGKCIGTFGITKDISKSIKIQQDIQEQNEELQAQEEELRQNLEEMQTVQENLEEQIKQNQLIQNDLKRDNTLLDALMNNLPDYLYFKNDESKFIRISKSMLHLFPVNSIEEMQGKSDFDFQPKESAQKYYIDEMNIIKTGKPIINEVAHEHMENGVDQWVSTTKLPLTDADGKRIGTFGITKNITELKERELQNKKLTEKLEKREKELLQKIKELEEKLKGKK